MKKLLAIVALSLSIITPAFSSPPSTFSEAKVIAKQKIYLDQANSAMGELYCGCKWTWVGKSGGRIDAESCGLKARKQENRAQRTEWEHIVPAWTFGNQRQCWKNGGREHCVDDDPVFRAMEADLFNLYPSVGEVNGDRSNFNYGMAAGIAPQYGQCKTRVDFDQQAAEPRDEVKGLSAIDAAAAAGGGQVYMPAGTYIVSAGTEPSDGCLMLKSNVYLYGDGMGVTNVKVADGSDTKITGVIRSAYGEETHDFGVSNLTIDGNRDNTTGKVDGWFNGYIPGEEGYDSNVTLDSVEIKDCSGYGFDPHEQTVNMVIKNSVSHGNGLDGFVADFLSDSTFENNIAYDNDRHGFNVVTSTHDFTLTNNIAYDNGGNGIVVQRGSEDIPSPSNITITGGEVYGNGAEGVLIKLSSEVTVTGVDIHDNASAGVRIYGSNHVEIIDNTLNNNSLGNPVPEIIIQSYDDTLGVSGNYRNATASFDDTITDFDITQDKIDLAGLGFTGLGNGRGGTLQVSYNASNDRTYIKDYDADASGNRFELILSGNLASTLTASNFILNRLTSANFVFATASTTNQAPVLATPLLDQNATESTPFSYVVPATSFTDPDNDSLSYIAKLADGSALPAWLTFDAATRTFSGTPSDTASGTYSIQVTATDGSNATVSDSFTLAVQDVPASSTASTNRTYLKDLTVDANGNRFEVSMAGNLVSSLTASHFVFAGQNTSSNVAPVVAIPLLDQNATESTPFSYTVARDSFTDANQDALVYTATLADGSALPAWLSFNATSLSFSGTPLSTASGNYNVLVKATDPSGASVSDSFALAVADAPATTIAGTNNAETLNGTAGADLILGLGGNDTIKAGTGADILDGGAGRDSLYGGDGADTFRYTNVLDSYRDYDTGGITATDTLYDFTVGVDKIDVSGLGFLGLGDGSNGTLYMTLNAAGDKTYVKSAAADADGNRFEIALNGNYLNTLTASDFVFGERAQQDILYLPTLGQSNARLLRMTEDDDQSGTSMLVKDLDRYTPYDVRSQFTDADGNGIDIAVGGSTVNGLSTLGVEELKLCWWLTDTDQPGPALLRAVALLGDQLSELQSIDNVTMGIIWGQGEEAAQEIGRATDKTAAA
eukprot:gene7563-7393_t